ncbi:hypothetical protein Golomagni_04539 [Golovinomyces magnicellulatus]|nr:hypothetical protein Golomagni_04539 [Golovinomyces magnicellulatus]
MTSTIGIPIKLLNEAQKKGRKSILTDLIFIKGHVVTLEITTGQVYRGKLLEGMPKFSQAIFFVSPSMNRSANFFGDDSRG